MVLSSFVEIISIGAVLPFLAVITNPDRVFNHSITEPLIYTLSLESSSQLILPLTLVFISGTIIAGCIRIFILFSSTKLSFATGLDVSSAIYQKTLYQPYVVHTRKNSSEIINGITTKVNAVIHVTMQSLSFISSTIITTVIIVAMVYVQTTIAIITAVSFSVIYFGITAVTAKRLLLNSRIIASETNKVVKCLQEGLGGIRDIIISGTQDIYCEAYRAADLPSRKAQATNSFISASPKYIVETLGMVVIALIAYSLTSHSNPTNLSAIPTLGLIALAAQRLLPNLQQAYGAWASIQGEIASFEDVIDMLEQEMETKLRGSNKTKLPFSDRIELREVSYGYNENSPLVINKLNLTIQAGTRIGFVGVTGSGKSTLMDLIMGLLTPNSGNILVDGVNITSENTANWQQAIAHVPQDIFLIDSSIAENIAFGKRVAGIDHDRVRLAAQQAKIAETIEAWPQRYDTVVGERGVRLSGGQRQRLGIARALYSDPSIIIFDEATSALDSETEKDVMRSIEELNDTLTILIVAHRTTTLEKCDKVIQLGAAGNIIFNGTYDQVFDKKIIG